jgi:uncharacterized membrane protein (UPF0127 family)
MQIERAPLALGLALALLAGHGCASDSPAAVVATAGGPVTVTLEVASTPDAMERGLMYRSSLPDGHGMLFTFPDESDHGFWMKNTMIPLDMLFVGADGRIVGIHADAVPLSEAVIKVGRPSRRVIEVPGGYAKRHGLAVGDAVTFRGVPAA